MERMSDDPEGADGADYVEIVGIAEAELSIPPVLHAVPAATVGPLAQYEMVTLPIRQLSYRETHDGEVSYPEDILIGWLVDETIIIDGPFGYGDDETYLVSSWSEHCAAIERPGQWPASETGPATAAVRSVRTADIWVYRATPGHHDLGEIPEWHQGLWFERIVPEAAQTPPSPRSPRPARELPSLTGRRLRGPTHTAEHTEGPDWQWWVALTEPISQNGSFVVRVTSIAHYQHACQGDATSWNGYHLHRLFTY